MIRAFESLSALYKLVYNCTLELFQSFFNFKTSVMKKHFLNLIPVVLFFLLACNGKKDEKKTTTDVDTTTKVEDQSQEKVVATASDNCIILTRDQINAWLQDGWDDPSDADYIAYLYFSPTDATPIRVQACPGGTTAGSMPQAGKYVDCRIKNIVPPCNLGPADVYNNKYFDFVKYFAEADHSLKQFSFLRLRYKTHTSTAEYPCTNCLSFDIEMVINKEGVETVYPAGDTKPSPPAILKRAHPNP